MLSTTKLRELCIQKKWFTRGSNSQYAKLFEMAEEDAPLNELALVIWVCSDGYTRNEILTALEEIVLPVMNCCTCRFWRTANLEGDMCCENDESIRYMEWTDNDEQCECWRR